MFQGAERWAEECAMIRLMGKKVKQRVKKAIDAALEGGLEAEAAYYARKVGITRDEAAKIIQEAHAPKLSIVRKDKAQ